MSRVRCEAVLLRSVDYAESDRIVHLLTSTDGRLTAIAKGARRSHRRFPGTLDVFNRLSIDGHLKPRASMAFLESARLIDPFLGLRADPARYALASFLVEMIDRLSPEGSQGSEAERLFRFTVESLGLLGRVRPAPTMRLLLELRALDALGLRPELGRCVRCGRVPKRDVVVDHIVKFHVADGGIVCTACSLRLDGLVPVEIGTLRVLEQGLEGEASDLVGLVLDTRALAQAARLVFRFQRFHVGVELRSERFLEQTLPMAGAGAACPPACGTAQSAAPTAGRSVLPVPAIQPSLRSTARLVGHDKWEDPFQRLSSKVSKPMSDTVSDSSPRDADDRERHPLAMDTLVSLCAARGFVHPASEIYGGIAGFWDYGPLGVELKNNLKAFWWGRMVRERDDVVGIDSAIISHPRTWEASGHVEHFSDPMVDCRKCKRRFRADQVEGERCPEAPKKRAVADCDLTEAREFNLMLRTELGASVDESTTAYLRPETCQPIFSGFKRVRESARQKVPFGIAQIGKAFRNEITPRNFTFRSREFEQAEMEFFCHPSEREEWFAHWRDYRLQFHRDIGFDASLLRIRPHAADELAHYARAADDIEFLFPFGWQEIEGIHDRGDWDLSRHTEYSGKELAITDEQTKERFTPMVIETSVGVDRTALALLVAAYTQETLEDGEERTVMRFHPAIAPIKATVLPLSKKLAEPARAIQKDLRRHFNCFYDDAGNIGRRYRRQDEVGTPFCITYDFESADDGCVTVRDRDTMNQERIPVDGLLSHLRDRLGEGL